MAISIEKVESVRQEAVFIQVPYLLHRAQEGWIPPLRMMEKNYLNPKKNRHFSHSEIVCFLAWRDGQPAGRIMGIVNRELEEVEKERQARFCSFECSDDEEAACRLLAAVEGWAKAQGLNRLVDPLGYFKIKRWQARTNRLDLLLGAVKQEYRGRGLDILMALAMLKSAQEAGGPAAVSEEPDRPLSRQAALSGGKTCPGDRLR